MLLSSPKKKIIWACLLALLPVQAFSASLEPSISEPKISSHKADPNHFSENGGYILGAGDRLLIDLLAVPEFSGQYTVAPDGGLILPRVRKILVEGLTIEELRNILVEKYSEFVVDPDVYVTISSYRPIRVYVGGEVQRPGYYFLSVSSATEGNSGLNRLEDDNLIRLQQPSEDSIPPIPGDLQKIGVNKGWKIPTVFDALRTAGGVTPLSKLADVKITRKRAKIAGGGKIQAKVNFLSLITEGDESQNIRLFDGDSIIVGKSEVELRDQIIQAGQTNLSPQFFQVYVTGRVRDPGVKVLRQGSSLDQALAAAGGQKLLRGRVEFVRFNRDGSTEKRRFFYSSSVAAGEYRNPVLMAGDVIRVNDSPFSAGVKILNEITGPTLSIYSLYNIFK